VIAFVLSSLRRRALLRPRTFNISLGPPTYLHSDSIINGHTLLPFALLSRASRWSSGRRLSVIAARCARMVRARSMLRIAGFATFSRGATQRLRVRLSLESCVGARRLSAALRPARECVRGILVRHCCTLHSSSFCVASAERSQNRRSHKSARRA
jgi:hypothetical protein